MLDLNGVSVLADLTVKRYHGGLYGEISEINFYMYRKYM